jgi:hypothetical protein
MDWHPLPAVQRKSLAQITAEGMLGLRLLFVTQLGHCIECNVKRFNAFPSLSTAKPKLTKIDNRRSG